ncbi:UDP-N-acetylmuramoyl-L-alanine--D-glutamate ligase, partial [Patescibacteria group bacterium]
VFRSPGIHVDYPELQKAREKGSNITSATKLFFDICPCPIIGVTGTKGKGTTSTLIYKILKNAGKNVYLGGNIGESPFGFIDQLNKNSLVVLELSSFQLQDLEKSPHIAVVLNTVSEHLDYHKDVEEYQAAKESIVKYQTKEDVVVANFDYPYHLRYLTLTPAEKFLVSVKKEVGDGTYVEKDKIISTRQWKKETICSTKEVGLIGPHNLENIMPAVTVARYLEIPTDVVKKTILEFRGLPHRLEFIREIDKISYYNDSFSTTPETCIAAIQSFTEPVVLIAGGSDKHSDYSGLAKAIVRQANLKTIVLMGETADKIEESINIANDKATEKADKLNIDQNRDVPLNIVRAKNYGEAFFAARLNAEKNGIVVLSPASASFDMFENYKKRGDAFRKWVESL